MEQKKHFTKYYGCGRCVQSHETLRFQGLPNSPATLQSAISGIQSVMLSNEVPFLLPDKGDQHFCELHLTLDSMSRDLYWHKVATARKSAAIIMTSDSLRQRLTGVLHLQLFCNALYFFI